MGSVSGERDDDGDDGDNRESELVR